MVNKTLTEEQVLELIDGQDLKMGGQGRERDRDRDKDRSRERDKDRDLDHNKVDSGDDHSEIIGDHDIYGGNILFDIEVC